MEKHFLLFIVKRDEAMNKALFEHLNVINMFRDAKPKLCTHSEALELGLDPVFKNYNDNELYVMCPAYYQQFSNTTQQINNAVTDFVAGWNAAMELVKDREDEAVAHREKARQEKEQKRCNKASKIGGYVTYEGDLFKVLNYDEGLKRAYIAPASEPMAFNGRWISVIDLVPSRAPKSF